MAQGEILDKLKIAGYVTSTDKSADIEEALDIHEGGDTPTGTIEITTNGDHDVTEYATAHVDVPTSGEIVDESSVSKFIGVSVYTYDVDLDTGDMTFVNGALLNRIENSNPVIITPEFISNYETKVAEEKITHEAAGDLDTYQLQDLTIDEGQVQINNVLFDVRIWDFQPDECPNPILFYITSGTVGADTIYFPLDNYLQRQISNERLYSNLEKFPDSFGKLTHSGINTSDMIMFIQGDLKEVFSRIIEGKGVPALYYYSQEAPGEDWLGQCKFVWVELTPQTP